MKDSVFALDANIFIEAHRRYYGVDLCPVSGNACVTTARDSGC